MVARCVHFFSLDPRTVIFRLALLAGSLLWGTVWADDYELGYQHYVAGEAEAAFAVWAPLAEQDDMRAQFGLATLYFEGAGVEQDARTSVYWFTRAAKLGFAPAQFNLGMAYKNGDGVQQDDSRANHWWLLAAEQEFTPAQFNLGTQYYFGHGVSPNASAALRWFRRAESNGHARAGEVITRMEAATGGPPAQAESSPTPIPTEDGNDWVLAQDDGSYTLQLLASPNRQAVNDFIVTGGLQGSSAVMEFTKSGGTWFAVLYGSYPDRATALAAATRVSAEIGAVEPWVRQFSAIKSVIE